MSNKRLTEKNSSLRIFLVVFTAGILSRLLLLLAGAAVLRITGSDVNIWGKLPEMGDAVHYIGIAKDGYAAAGETANRIVFFPLYPLLIRVVRTVLRSYELSALVVSYASFGVASAYLYKLMRLDYDEKKAIDALLLLFIAPFGLFFISIHTESLFLMLTLISLYYMRKENWLIAALAGFFASLAKSQGVMLLFAAACEAAICTVRDKKFNKKSLFILLIPLGFVVYLCMNKIIQGDFFAFVAHQSAAPWYNTAKWVSDSLSTSYEVGTQYYSLALIIYAPQIVLFFAAVALIFVGLYKRVRTSYLAFMGMYVLMTYFHGWMLSGARYVTSCAVIYVVMAAIDNKFVKYLLCLVTGSLCIYTLYLWLLGYSIM